MYVYQPLLKRRYPTLDEARRALTLADYPDARYRDVRPLMAILQALIHNSPRLRGHQMIRRTAITSFDWDLVPYDQADVDRAALARTRLRPVIKELLKAHAQRPLFGALAFELDWIPMTAAGTAPRILRRHRPLELERVGDDLSGLAVLGDETIARRREIAQEPPQSWVWGVDDELPIQGGILRSLIFHELLQNESLVEWANFTRKLKGMIVAREADDASVEDRQTAAQAVRSLVSNNFVSMGKEIEVEFAKIVDGAAGASFKDFKDALVADAAIAILGQANTSELPEHGGSRAGLQVLNLIRADIHYADMVAIEEIINGQLVLHDWQINNSPTAAEAPWQFRLSLAEEQDVERNARVIGYALDAGVALRKSEVYDRLGYTQPAPDDEIFTPPAAAPGGLAL